MRILKELLPQVKGEGQRTKNQDDGIAQIVLTREEWQVLVWAYLNRRAVDGKVRIYYKDFSKEILDRTFKDGQKMRAEDYKSILSGVETKTCMGGYYTMMHWVQDICDERGNEVGAVYVIEDPKVPNEETKQHPYLSLNDEVLLRLVTEGREVDERDRDAFMSPPCSWKDVTYLYAVILRSLRQLSYGPKNARKRCGANAFKVSSFEEALGYSKSTFTRRINELKGKELLTIKTHTDKGAMFFVDTVDSQLAKKIIGSAQWMFHLAGTEEEMQDSSEESLEETNLSTTLPDETSVSANEEELEDFADVPDFAEQGAFASPAAPVPSASPFSLEDIDF